MIRKRKYKAIKNRPGVSQILKVDIESGKETVVGYSGRRYEFDPSKGKCRKQKDFSTFPEAQDFVQGLTFREPSSGAGDLFGEVLDAHLSPNTGKQESTLIRYAGIAKHLVAFRDIPIRDVTSRQIDNWLEWLRSPEAELVVSSRRKSFKHELDLLQGVFSFYKEMDDSNTFISPVKKRHRVTARMGHRPSSRNKDLSLDEFNQFLWCLRLKKHGDIYADVATIQFYHALRISEATGVQFEGVKLDRKSPCESRLIVFKSVKYLRKKGYEPKVEDGFKNSASLEGAKEHHLFPETYEVFLRRHSPWGRGSMFLIDGKVITYRQMQSSYDGAFKKAGLPYRGTHVLRHGGCRDVFNQTGDLAVAQQHLGNTDLKTTQVYAQRSASAFASVVKKRWDAIDLVANGGNE